MSISQTRLHYGWVILALGLLSVFGSLGLGRFGYAMVLPDMKEGLQIGDTEAGAIATAGLSGYLALSVIGGILASRYGPRLVIGAGLGAAGMGMILTGMANSFGQVMAAQLLTGMGSGASNIPVVGLVASWIAPRRLGSASGIIVSGSSLGLVLVGFTTPLILGSREEEGWRLCWYVFGTITIALAVIAFLLIRNHPSDKNLKPLGASNDPPIPAIAKQSGNLEWGRVYRSRVVWQLGLVYIAFGLSYIIYMTFFREQLTEAGGYSKQEAGALYLTMGLVSFVCGPLWGHVSDRFGRKWALMMVYLIHMTTFSLFGLWTTPTGFTISAILFGLSAWSIPAIMNAACGEIVGYRLAPAALGFITLFFGIGQTIGPIIAGTMADTSGSLTTAYIFAASVAFLGAIGAVMFKSGRPHLADEIPIPI